MTKMREQVIKSAALPISESYTILSWAIANATRLYGDTDQVTSILRPLFDSTILTSRLNIRVMERAAHDSPLLSGYDSSNHDTEEESIIVGVNDREKVISFVDSWIRENVSEYLKIADPYFSAQDLDFLKLVAEHFPSIRIIVLTSIKRPKSEKWPVEEQYRSYWREISIADFPDVDFIFTGIDSNQTSPIHDRFWVTKSGGLEFGTSLNSSGISNISKVVKLCASKAANWEARMDQFASRSVREHKSERLKYQSFTF